jgi:hypothetical protein
MSRFACIVLFFLTISSSNLATASFIDNGNCTTETTLGIDIYDVMLFSGKTYQEVVSEISQMGGGWRLAQFYEVNSIYNSLNEEQYVSQVRDMLGYHELGPIAPGRYVTGGRIAFTDPGNPSFSYLAGFGNGIQHYDYALQQSIFQWGLFGIGWDLAETRFSDFGAWVVRDHVSPVSAPPVLLLILTALGLLCISKRFRKDGQPERLVTTD